MKHPRRGEIWLVDFNPVRRSEQAGLRSAIVIQNNDSFQFDQKLPYPKRLPS
jgi:mRNA-degrading endonuclease toxin of MazEF toxin-antitoxin module